MKPAVRPRTVSQTEAGNARSGVRSEFATSRRSPGAHTMARKIAAELYTGKELAGESRSPVQLYETSATWSASACPAEEGKREGQRKRSPDELGPAT